MYRRLRRLSRLVRHLGFLRGSLDNYWRAGTLLAGRLNSWRHALWVREAMSQALELRPLIDFDSYRKIRYTHSHGFEKFQVTINWPHTLCSNDHAEWPDRLPVRCCCPVILPELVR